jgi:hypothetical protein
MTLFTPLTLRATFSMMPFSFRLATTLNVQEAFWLGGRRMVHLLIDDIANRSVYRGRYNKKVSFLKVHFSIR